MAKGGAEKNHGTPEEIAAAINASHAEYDNGVTVKMVRDVIVRGRILAVTDPAHIDGMAELYEIDKVKTAFARSIYPIMVELG